MVQKQLMRELSTMLLTDKVTEQTHVIPATHLHKDKACVIISRSNFARDVRTSRRTESTSHGVPRQLSLAPAHIRKQRGVRAASDTSA